MVTLEFFASQCTRSEKNSKLPLLLMNTDKRLNTVSIKKDHITLLIKSLYPTKAHSFNNISIRMIRLCRDCVTFPLVQTFKSSLSQGVFPDTWKMANIIPFHKKR